MLLTNIFAVPAVSAPLLGGCFGPDDSKKPWMAHSQKCEQLGFKRALSGGLQNIPNAASNWRATRRHEGARQLHQSERPMPHRREIRLAAGQAGKQSPAPFDEVWGSKGP
jgi:hypothetical protein